VKRGSPSKGSFTELALTYELSSPGSLVPPNDWMLEKRKGKPRDAEGGISAFPTPSDLRALRTRAGR